jgi:hypothetical protein
MISFLRREQPAPQTPSPAPSGDSQAALTSRLVALVALINSSAGRLPVEALVTALYVTDALRDVISDVDDPHVDIHALVTLEGILDDYLPTTLKAYLSLEPSDVEVARPSGESPRASLLDQLEALWLAATDLLAAVRAHDADQLLAQGSFLRTKFTGSDLDL